MFDLNNDKALTFEEFMFATSAQNFDTVTQKLGWLFDNVYDRVRKMYLPCIRICNKIIMIYIYIYIKIRIDKWYVVNLILYYLEFL